MFFLSLLGCAPVRGCEPLTLESIVSRPGMRQTGRAMEAVLLILVLAAGDPGSLAAAQAVADGLRQQEAAARIMLPPDATAELAKLGLRDADLVGRSEKPLQATAGRPRLVLVRVERREAGDDRVIEVELWAGGRTDRMVAAVARAADPLPLAVEGARRLLREAARDPAQAQERTDTAFITGFAARGDWQGLIAAVDADPDARPRLRHAAIMARLRLGDRPGAERALAALRQTHPDHPLTTAAATAVAADAGGADALRDPPPPRTDDHTLR